MAKSTYGLNESQVIKLIKTAYKNGCLGVVLVNGTYYVTNEHWILRVLPCHQKILTAITEAIGPVISTDNPEYTQRQDRIGFIVDLFNKICTSEGEDADISPWMYLSKSVIVQFVNTYTRSYSFNRAYLQMFNDSCQFKIVTSNLPRNNSHKFVAFYSGEPIGMLLEVMGEYVELPKIISCGTIAI